MRSRQLHALVTLAPAVVLAAAAVAAVGLLVRTAGSEGLLAPMAIGAAMFAWPATIAAASLLARAVRGLAGAMRQDPIRTLGIAPIGHAWRIPLRRRDPLTSASLAVAATGVAIAAPLTSGVLGTPDIWLLVAGIGGSLVVGLAEFALVSVLFRHQDRSLVLDPHAGELIVPAMAGRSHVVRIALARVHEVGAEPHGLLGLLHRTTIVFDDDLLGPGVRLPLISRVDPARAQDLAAWINGAVRSVRGPAAPAPASAPAASITPPPSGGGSVIAGPGAGPMDRTSRGGGFPAAARHRRSPGRGIVGAVGRMNMPVVLSGLGLLCVAGALAAGVRVGPRTSVAAEAPARMSLLGRSLDGDAVHASDTGADWTWVVDVAPGQNASDQQLAIIGRLLPRWPDGVSFRICLIRGERAGDPVDARLGRRVATLSGLPESIILLRRDHGSAVPRHRLVDAEGRVVHEAVGFHAASSIESIIDLRRLAARLDVDGPAVAPAAAISAVTASLETSP